MPNRYDDVMLSLDAYFHPAYLPYGEKEIAHAETLLNEVLPEDYRHFLEKYAYSSVRSAVFPTYSDRNKEGGTVGVFFGFNPEHTHDLIRTWRAFRGRVPDRFLPFSSSPGGLLCICLSGPNRGGIYWWGQAEEDDDPNKNLLFVWPDFDGFMRSLKPPPD